MSGGLDDARADASRLAGADVRTRDAERARLNALDAAAWVTAARRGDLLKAWRYSDRIMARTIDFANPAVPRHLQQVWNGSPLLGRRVLVRCYHGLGDTIQFVRYLAPLRRIARHVVVWVQPALLPLLAYSHPGLDLLPLHDGTPEVDYDVDLEIMELAYVFRTTLDTIPRAIPYLDAPVASIDDEGRPRVGVVWRAGEWDGRRSVPFEVLLLLLLLAGRDVAWFSLQHHATAVERHPALRRLEVSTPLATASCMRALDLVISIDSMTAHLAGALGVRVWTLLPHEADWRWLEGLASSPWYPTMELFRQPHDGAWGAVIEQVAQRLTEIFPSSRRDSR